MQTNVKKMQLRSLARKGGEDGGLLWLGMSILLHCVGGRFCPANLLCTVLIGIVDTCISLLGGSSVSLGGRNAREIERVSERARQHNAQELLRRAKCILFSCPGHKKCFGGRQRELGLKSLFFSAFLYFAVLCFLSQSTQASCFARR
jgi:hypothetical protein